MKAYKSPLRLFAFGVVGLVLIVAAIDVMFVHTVSTPPEANDGVLTTRGRAQQRGDMVWGAAMVGTGVLLVGGAVVELVRRKPQVVVESNGLTLAVGPGERDVEIGWENIESVSSEVGYDPYDGAKRRYLVVDVYDRTELPDAPLGAEWHGNELRVDTDDWTRPVTDVALSAQGALGHYRRVEEIKQMEPPSLVWETTVDQPEGSDPSVSNPATELRTAPPEAATEEAHASEAEEPDEDSPIGLADDTQMERDEEDPS